MSRQRLPVFTVLMAVLLGCGALLVPSRAAYAATITVTTTADELDTNSACSLREAIRAANTNAKVGACVAGSGTGTDTITVPAGTYVLTRTGADEEANVTGDLDVTGATKIVGAGMTSTIIDGNRTDRVLNVKVGGTLTLTKATVRNGLVGSGVTTTVYGGGIYNGGTLTLTTVTVTANRIEASGAGGGIYNNGKLTVSGSTISENYTEGGSGGGIYNAASRSATITNSRISGNDSDGAGGIANSGTLNITSSTLNDNRSMHSGGGIASNGGTVKVVQSTISSNGATEHGGGVAVYTGSTVTLINSTVSGNSGGDDTAFQGGGLSNGGGTLNVYSSTIARNQGGTGGIVGSATLANTIVEGNTTHQNAASDCRGTLTSRGYNLISYHTADCTITGDTTGNLLNVSAGLGSLQNNGGSTLTHALPSTSRAVDAGNPATPSATLPACPTKDQRNITRPRDSNGDGGARCDIGAVER